MRRSDVALLVDEVRARLRDVQERTRQMITDLSPPGLYDLGLVPALQWLVVYMRGHDGLSVELDADVREEWIKLDIRVLVFKLVRELLRNVVKHAGVSKASVQVRGDDQGAARGGVGSWQGVRLADGHVRGARRRIRAVEHRETARRKSADDFRGCHAGAGSRFELVFPLGVLGARLTSGRTSAAEPAGVNEHVAAD